MKSSLDITAKRPFKKRRLLGYEVAPYSKSKLARFKQKVSSVGISFLFTTAPKRRGARLKALLPLALIIVAGHEMLVRPGTRGSGRSCKKISFCKFFGDEVD